MSTAPASVAAAFEAIGGEFITSPAALAHKLASVRAFLFDWDGVFNGGTKGEGMASTYAEPDAMGVNLLRFGHWLGAGALPTVGILTALDNPTAAALARREHFDAVYYGFKHKLLAFDHFLENYHLRADEVAFVFDDAIDLSVAQRCGVRLAVNRAAGVLFKAYLRTHHLADYLTASAGNACAVREVCELALGLRGQFDAVLAERIAFGGAFSTYMAQRNLTAPRFFAAHGPEVREAVS